MEGEISPLNSSVEVNLKRLKWLAKARQEEIKQISLTINE